MRNLSDTDLSTRLKRLEDDEYGTDTPDEVTFGGRSLTPPEGYENNVINVPEDVPTIQEAVDIATALIIDVNRISVQVAPGTYDEDVYIPPFVSEGGREGIDGDAFTFQINGDRTTPSNVEVSSITAVSSTGRASPFITGLTLTGKSPYEDEEYAISCLGANEVGIRDCAFASTCTNGIMGYSASIDARDCDFGSGNVDRAFLAKRGTMLTAHSCTGTPNTAAFKCQWGFIRIHPDCTMNSPVAVDSGFVFDERDQIIHYPYNFTHQNAADLVMGWNARGPATDGNHETVYGFRAYAEANQDGQVAVGKDAHTQSGNATAVGNGADATGLNSTALGAGATMADSGGIALGGDQLCIPVTDSTVSNAEMENGEAVLDLDEAGNALDIRVKDSTGTVRTGSIALDP